MTIRGKYGIISMLVSEFHLSEMLVYQIFPKCHLPFLGANGTFFVSWFLPAACRLKYISLLLQAEPAGRSYLC